MDLHPIPPGLWCVPSALVAITGADWESVIHPSLNRHGGAGSLTAMVVGTTMQCAKAVLVELGYTVRPYKHAERHTLATWAERSLELYPGRVLLIGVPEHAVVVKDGRVFDTWTPHGGPGGTHPFASDTAITVWLVEAPR